MIYILRCDWKERVVQQNTLLSSVDVSTLIHMLLVKLGSATFMPTNIFNILEKKNFQKYISWFFVSIKRKLINWNFLDESETSELKYIVVLWLIP